MRVRIFPIVGAAVIAAGLAACGTPPVDVEETVTATITDTPSPTVTPTPTVLSGDEQAFVLRVEAEDATLTSNDTRLLAVGRGICDNIAGGLTQQDLEAYVRIEGAGIAETATVSDEQVATVIAAARRELCP